MAAGASASGAGAAGQDLAAAHKALLDTPGIQFDFQRVVPPEPPTWLDDLVRLLSALAPFVKPVFWVLVIAGAALILWFVVAEVAGLKLGSRKRQAAGATDWRPDAAHARALLDDADRLAAEGRFGEAIHLLLFRSIDDLAGRRPGLVRPALTSRDIARLDALPGEARAAFARIAEAVERSFFGGRSVGQDEFRAARADYEAFAFAGAWR
ncbi:DUF4129 domain-containing protein [Phenylobacterium sp.]|uniref:DUF4129 domain-containing protein n=1 Tax=Phenylobacterium sp. TaxID=1871053 RepID=UPI0035AE2087